ncbi:hypothetical protein Taro_031751, partial [Colocasia esculenta]|nr:hypothetical protein [Colocasia esculenta]
ISESVYKTSVDWIAQRPTEGLATFVLWTLDSIFADLASQQATVKVSKKPVQQPSTKAQVAIFVVLAMTLRRKPDVLSSILPTLRENAKYQGQDKLPIIVWAIAQASQGDPVVGMYAWVHNLLPLMFGKSSGNAQVRDLILQLVERILSGPKARPILLNGAVRKGERLVPPPALEQLMRLTFPSPSSRIKMSALDFDDVLSRWKYSYTRVLQATERFEAIYPTIKELALAGSPGAKAMKPVSQQLLPASVKFTKENIPELTKEATDIFIWCLTQNPECFKQWEKLHIENVEASAAVLQKLADGWKQYATKFSPPDSLRESLKVLRSKNEEALAGGLEASTQATIKSADKYCKVILGRLSRGIGCLKGGLLVLTLAIAAGTFAVSPNMDSLDWKKLHVMFSSAPSF